LRIQQHLFHGEISEILVYNRVLSANEAASVESYLRNKFGTSSWITVTQSYPGIDHDRATGDEALSL